MAEKLINVETVPHDCQRYDTCGDWQVDLDPEYGHQEPTININVSRMNDWRYEFLVAIHEIIEAALCHQWGITDKDVDAWDLAHLHDCDPGDLPGAPYRKQHIIASCIEKMLALELDVNWEEYEFVIKNLSGETKRP